MTDPAQPPPEEGAAPPSAEGTAPAGGEGVAPPVDPMPEAPTPPAPSPPPPPPQLDPGPPVMGGLSPGVVAALLAPPPGGGETDELAELERFSETLLTTSSILAGFAIAGLFGLPQIGSEGLQLVAERDLGHRVSVWAYMIVFHAMLLATLCFLGVLISITFVRLRKRYPSARSLRTTLRGTVVIFGVGLAALFAAIISFALPNAQGFTLAVCAGMGIIGALFYRAFLQN